MGPFVLSDKMPRRVGFVNHFLGYSPALPWQQESRQQGWYTSGTLRKQFTKPIQFTKLLLHFVS